MAMNTIWNSDWRAAHAQRSKVPLGKTKAEAEEAALVLQRMRALAQVMDTAFRIPGTNFRFGWDAILGFIPGVGDLATGIVSASIVGYALKLGVRKRTAARMLANLGVDVAVGAVPLLGDMFDAGFKANIRNVALLERELARRAKAGS